MDVVFALLLIGVGLYIAYKILRKLLSLTASGGRYAYDHREEIASGIGATGRAAGKTGKAMGQAAAFVGGMLGKGAKAAAEVAEDALRERRLNELVALESNLVKLTHTVQSIQAPALKSSAEAVHADIVLLKHVIQRQRRLCESPNFIINHLNTSKEMEHLHQQVTHLETEVRRLLDVQESIWTGQSGNQRQQSSQSSAQPQTDLEKAYALFDLDPDCSDADVKKQHRMYLKMWHPDRAGDNPDLQELSKRKTQQLNDAYDTIKKARGF